VCARFLLCRQQIDRVIDRPDFQAWIRDQQVAKASLITAPQDGSVQKQTCFAVWQLAPASFHMSYRRTNWLGPARTIDGVDRKETRQPALLHWGFGLLQAQCWLLDLI
jgi:hypothetical protein